MAKSTKKGSKPRVDMAVLTVNTTIPSPPTISPIDTPAESTKVDRPIPAKEHTVTQIKIQGLIFNVESPYEEGHTLTAGEAAALNQVLHENLRNNFASTVKKAVEANGNITAEDLQPELDKYAESYQFGVRVSRGGTRTASDPVLKKALGLAEAAIKAKLASLGKSLKEVGGVAWLKERANELVEKNPAFKEQAKQRLAEEQELAAGMADLAS